MFIRSSDFYVDVVYRTELCLLTFKLSYQGVPMIYMGDEYGHTKGGNNNTYCHDNYVILLSTRILIFQYHLLVNSVNPNLFTA